MPTDRALRHTTWGYTALYALWVLAMTSGVAPRGVANDLLSLPAYFIPGAMLMRAARGPIAERRVRAALAVLGAAWILPGLSFLLALVPGWDETAAGHFLGWGMYYAFYPFALAGLGLLAILPRDRGVQLRLAIDSALVVAAAATIQWYFVVRMQPGTPSLWGTAQSLGILFPAELFIVFGAAILVYRPVAAGAWAWPRWLGAGMFIGTLADFVYEYRKLVDEPWPGPTGDLVFAVSGALVASAALGAGTTRPAAAVAREPIPGWVALPYVAIAAVACLLCVEALAGRISDPVAGLVTGGGILVALVIGKLALEQRALDRAHQHREALDARFRALVQRSTDAIVVVDSGERITYASPAFAPLAPTGNAEGRPFRDVLPDASDDLASLAALGRPARWAAGDRCLDATVTDLRHDPAVLGHVVNLRDVTEQVRLEHRLRDAHKLEAVGRMASSVAHDFNNLLTVVLGNAALALANGADRSRGQWEAVRGVAERGAALARQLLSLGRPAARDGALCDLTAELPRIVATLRTILPSSLRVELVVPGETAVVPVAPAELEQLMLNLALNARDATPGAGTLTIQAELQPHGAVQLCVTDTGAGMDASTVALALEPFFSTKAPHAGTGLGLSIARQIARDAGGELTLTSTPGVGTTVIVVFPQRTGVALPTVSPSSEPTPAGRIEGRVLLVDDERAVREVLARYLQAVGFTTFEASDGADALSVLERQRWEVDVVLTDLVMPNVSGPELIRRVRAHAPHLPILCMSGNGLSPTDTDTARLLAAPVIQKPPALDRVAAQLSAAILKGPTNGAPSLPA